MSEARGERWPELTAEQEEGLIEFLERDQLVLDKARPLDRARLSQTAIVALWILRIFVTVVGAMVIYAFIDQLGG